LIRMQVCPSCGKEQKTHSNTCEYCGAVIPVGKQDPLVEPISPYDDLFSDDIIPDKPLNRPEIKGPVLPPDDEFFEPEPESKPNFSFPGHRELMFIGGIALAGIIIIMLLVFMPSPPPDSLTVGDEFNQTSVIENTSEVTEETTSVPTMESSSGYSFSDGFSNKESGWGEYTSDTFMRYYSQGEYHMIQKGEDMLDKVLLGEDAKNFEVEVKTRLDSGPMTGQYGIIFRFSDDDHYLFGINGRGWFTVTKHVDGKVYELIPLTETYILNKGYVTNKLGVKTEGNTMSLYINGKMVRAISDTSITHGDVGFFVARLSEKGYVKEQGVKVSFDDFSYKELTS